MAVSNANYEFVNVDVGRNGRMSDAGVWGSSKLCAAMEGKTANIPPPKQLPDSTKTLPHFMVGDDAFPQASYTMKPFPFRDQNEEQRIYSYRLSRARRVIENSFGILCSKFRVFQKPIALHPDKVENVVLACVVLHNMMRRDYSEHYIQPGLADEENVTAGRVIAGSWRDVHQSMGLHHTGKRNLLNLHGILQQ